MYSNNIKHLWTEKYQVFMQIIFITQRSTNFYVHIYLRYHMSILINLQLLKKIAIEPVQEFIQMCWRLVGFE